MSSPLIARLHEVRRRLRRVALLAGMCQCLLALLGLLAAFFAVDWLLLPHLVDGGSEDRLARGLLDLAAIALMAWVVAATLLRELSSERSDDQIALRIEREHPSLDGRLISSVQLARGLAIHGERPASAELIAALARETIQRSQAIDFGSIVDRRRLARSAMAAGILLLLAGGAGWWQRDLASALLARVILGQAAYPTAAAILRVSAAGVAGHGDAYPIEIELDAARAVPDRAVARIRSATSPEVELTLERQPGIRQGRVRYLGTLEHALEDFSVRIQALDARWPSAIPVHVIDRPMIRSVSETCIFPAYLGRPDEVTSGDLRVPVGTTVRLHASVTKPLERATLVRRSSGAASAASAASSAPMAMDAARTGLDASFTVAATGTYELRLLDRDGFENADPIAYPITAIPDLPPVVSIQFPGHDKLATATAQWPIRFTVKDDHGIARGWIRYFLERGDDAPAGDAPQGNGAKAAEPIIQKIAISGLAKPGELEVRREVILNLGKLGVAEGMRVVYWIEAEDDCQPTANIGRSPRFTFTVVDRASISDRFEHDKSLLLNGIEGLRDRQSRMKSDIDTVRKAAP